MGAFSSAVTATGDFTEEQKQYLRGFFTAVAQQRSFVGQLGNGLLTNDAASGAPPITDERSFSARR